MDQNFLGNKAEKNPISPSKVNKKYFVKKPGNMRGMSLPVIT